MRVIQNEFSKDLTIVLNRHKKAFTINKEGVFLVDTKDEQELFIGEAETATETGDRLIFARRS